MVDKRRDRKEKTALSLYLLSAVTETPGTSVCS